MKKSTLLMIVSVVLAMTLSLGGTLAYLQDSDSDVNVMTLGSVYIEQHEQERTDKTTTELEGNLEEFQKNHPHPLFPAIKELIPAKTEWTDGTDLDIWPNNNVVDKFVTVENTGKSGAYVRTAFAVEYAEGAVAPVLNWNTFEWTTAKEIGTMQIPDGESALYKVYVVYYDGILAAKDITAPSLMQVALPCTAGNEDVEAYGDQLDIIVLTQAVQTEGFDNAEEALNEAFGSDTDEEKVAAWFGGVKYPEDEEAGTTDDLMTILANATEGAPLYITLTGNVTYPTEGTHDVKDITPASSVVIDGQGQYKLTATGSGVTPIGDAEAPLTLKNLTVVDESVSYAESSWEFGYLELGGPEKFLCENVTFENPIMVSGDNAVFTNCTFTGIDSEYGVWVNNGTATFTNCTFVGTRGMKICDMYEGDEVPSVVIDQCTFSNLTKKPGVAIDNREGNQVSSKEGMSVVIKNSTFINCQPGDQDNYIYETDNVVPTLENNTVLNNAVEVANATELLNLSNTSVNGAIILTDDIDLNGASIQAIGAAYGKELIVLGNGHKISNAKVDAGTHNGMNNYGLFYAYTNSTLNISDLVIENVTVEATASNYGAAVVIGYMDGGSNVTLTNVDVKNSSVENSYDEAAVYVGYQTGTLNMVDCDSTGCTVEGETATKTGAFIGHVNGTSATLTNCTTDLTINATNRNNGTLTIN